MPCLLNIDLGELDAEPEELYALAHVANIACGGHVGDDASMALALERCARHRTRAGAHPSYPDRAGFGRARQDLAPGAVRDLVAAQCARLLAHAERIPLPVELVKPHGALYHAAAADPALARAVVEGAARTLGKGITVIGPAASALAEAARDIGASFAREAFADRGMRPDGSLIPRGQPGALIAAPEAARDQAQRLLHAGAADTLCVHGDTPGAVRIARAVRGLLDQRIEVEPFGDGALRLALPAGHDPRAVLDALRALPAARDVVVAEEHACVLFDPAQPIADPAGVVRAALARRPGGQAPPATIRVRYDGPDLARVAAWAGIPVEEVVRLHAAPTYTARMVGFLPGFAYLGTVDPRIAAPRLASPRRQVPAGAVGIAGARTGVYPFSSPGGWNLIGTALGFAAFDPERGAALAPGDRVRFERA